MDVQLFVGRRSTIFRPLAPILNSFVKPNGGLWTSTYRPEGRYASDWIEWCVANDMKSWLEGYTAQLITIKDDARVYTVNGYLDLKELHTRFGNPEANYSSLLQFLNYEKMAEHYDGMHLTEYGQYATRLTFPLNLYGWDCESTIWFRDCFKSVEPYTGELIRKV